VDPDRSRDGRSIRHRSLAAANERVRFSTIVLTSRATHDRRFSEKGAALSPDGKWIAYLSDARGRMDVWVKFLTGGEAANLTASSNLDITTGTGITGLEIAPDGAHIVVMAKPLGRAGQFESWEVPAPLPGTARKLLDAREFGVRWSPDGPTHDIHQSRRFRGDALWVADADGPSEGADSGARRPSRSLAGMESRRFIYFIHTFSAVLNLDQAQIYRIDARGGTMEPVVATSRRAMYPVLTPDGSGLIYAANPSAAELSLWWRPLAGGDAKRLTVGVGEYAEPRISSDGRTIIATLYDLRQSLNRIDGAGHTRGLTDGYGGDLDPAISPVSDQLVFTSSRSGNRNLWTANSDGSSARPLTTGTALDEQPSFSPDGRQIAFISDRGGRRAIWTMNADGGTPRKIVDTPASVDDVVGGRPLDHIRCWHWGLSDPVDGCDRHG
jgi:Tol biopolymer transport system component